MDEINELHDEMNNVAYRAGVYDGIMYSTLFAFAVILIHGVFA